MTLTELPQVQALSVLEKLELVDDLWRSVSSELRALDASPEEKILLDQRWESFLSSPSHALSVDDFRQQLNGLRA